VLSFTDYTAGKVRSLYTSAADLRSKWSDADERAAIIAALEDRGITFEKLAEEAGQPSADPFDLLCHIAFNAPLRTRRERAKLLRQAKKDFFEQYSPEARQVLNDILDKYIEYDIAQFKIPDILKLPPISDRGTIIEISALFGGADPLREAVTKMQELLYAA
jgi:type I restriction enzyme, R subunit